MSFGSLVKNLPVFAVSVTGACSGESVTLGAGWAVLPILLDSVTYACLGVFVPTWEWVKGHTGVALTRQPLRTMWFQPGSRLSCSAEGPA